MLNPAKITFLFILLSHMILNTAVADSKNVLIFADKVTFDNKSKKSKLEGDVIVKQGSRSLHASKAFTFGDHTNDLIKALAYGDAHERASFTAQLPNSKDIFNGKADELIYLPKKNEIILKGHAEIKKGKNIYKAPEIKYNLKEKRIVSIKKNSSRTKIIIKEKVA